MAKTLWSFGRSECNRIKGKVLHPISLESDGQYSSMLSAHNIFTPCQSIVTECHVIPFVIPVSVCPSVCTWYLINNFEEILMHFSQTWLWICLGNSWLDNANGQISIISDAAMIFQYPKTLRKSWWIFFQTGSVHLVGTVMGKISQISCGIMALANI